MTLGLAAARGAILQVLQPLHHLAAPRLGPRGLLRALAVQHRDRLGQDPVETARMLTEQILPLIKDLSPEQTAAIKKMLEDSGRATRNQRQKEKSQIGL